MREEKRKEEISLFNKFLRYFTREARKKGEVGFADDLEKTCDSMDNFLDTNGDPHFPEKYNKDS